MSSITSLPYREEREGFIIRTRAKDRPVTHDYRCPACGHIERDHTSSFAPTCIECLGRGDNVTMEITFQEWTDLALNDDNLTDRKGKRKAFTVADDPLALAEIGLAEDARTRRMPPELSAEYLHKYAVEGDSPKLRNEILEKAAEVSRGGG